MSFFYKSDRSNKWEKKYFSLLDEHDALSKTYQKNEELLCKTINRLALAAAGYNRDLDPYLMKIRKQLKTGRKNDKLTQMLEEFSDALLNFSDPPTEQSGADPDLLIEFLIRQFPNRQSDLERAYRSFNNDGEVGLQDLLLTLHELIDVERSVVSEIHQISLDEIEIRKRLMDLLEGCEVPESLRDHSEQLKMRLQNHDDALADILGTAFALMLSIKEHFQAEQYRVTELLSQLSDQLGKLEKSSSDVVLTTENEQRTRRSMDQSLSSGITELQHNMLEASELEPLKVLINSRLEKLLQQLESQQQQKRQEEDQLQSGLRNLTEQIKKLESASRELSGKLDSARQKAIRDPLTGLPNRLGYEAKLILEINRRQRRHAPLSMIIWDVDWFRKINDTFGRKAGDNTLKIIARLLEKHCRETDFIARFGGEEFTMLLPQTDVKAAYGIAEELREMIANTGFNSNGKKIAITLSCGISELTNHDTGDDLYNRVKEALFRAKENGRNRCVVASWANNAQRNQDMHDEL